MIATHNIIDEPRGSLYYQFLEIAQNECCFALFAIRHTITLNKNGQAALAQFEQYKISSVEAHEDHEL